MTDARRHAPATSRNRDAILAVLRDVLPPTGLVLEIASGTGEHAAYFARSLPRLEWQPTDPDPDALASIDAWRVTEDLPNLRQPLALNAAAPDWPVERADAVVCINNHSNSCDPQKTAIYDACVCINMVHISDWAATLGLFEGCAKMLKSGAPLVLYGPYMEDGIETAQSNLEFDQSLKQRNPAWGLRNVTDVDEVAAAQGFERTNRYEMPANNLVLVYRKF